MHVIWSFEMSFYGFVLLLHYGHPQFFWGCQCEVRGGGDEIHPVLKLLFQTNATSEEGKLTGHDYTSRETTKRFEGHLSWLVNLPPPEIMV